MRGLLQLAVLAAILLGFVFPFAGKKLMQNSFDQSLKTYTSELTFYAGYITMFIDCPAIPQSDINQMNTALASLKPYDEISQLLVKSYDDLAKSEKSTGELSETAKEAHEEALKLYNSQVIQRLIIGTVDDLAEDVTEKYGWMLKISYPYDQAVDEKAKEILGEVLSKYFHRNLNYPKYEDRGCVNPKEIFAEYPHWY